MTIDIARLVRVAVSDAEINSIISHVIARERGDRSNPGRSTRRAGLSRHPDRHVGVPRNDSTVSVAFVSGRSIRSLNRTYHGEDRVTDVLAFGQPQVASRKPQAADPTFLPLPVGGGARGGGDFGELVVCPSHVRANAKRAGEPFRRELIRVLVHGTLHLLGHDHARPREAERMFGLQEKIVRGIRHQRKARS